MKKGEIFNSVEVKKPQSTTFDLSHDKKMSFNMGMLIPTLVMDCLPGDKIAAQTSHFLRLAPLLAPVMHEVNVYQHFFFVPNRLVWPNWEAFITGGEDGEAAPVFPFINVSGAGQGSLRDYMGVPPIVNGPMAISALPFAAYNKIYNEYYRDQNFTPKIADKCVDGLNVIPTDLKRRAWEHDYFTSALPWTQRGVEATIPLGKYADLAWYGIAEGNPLVADTKIRNTTTGALVTTALNTLQGHANGSVVKNGYVASLIGLDVTDHTRVDLTTATAATINELRAALRLQEWLEKTARGGSRYIEMIFAHFGVASSDARLQRPEYLGGGRSRIQFGEVFQTVETTETPLGEMGGKATSASATKTINYFAEEHGYLIGIMSIIPRSGYQQGLPKHYRKFDKLDFGWPSLANLGEQAVDQTEIFADATKIGQTFGYLPQYTEYKYMMNSVHGDFRQSLNYWHMSRDFEYSPNLSTEFIECEPTTRIFAVNDGTHKVWAHVYNFLKASRKLPAYGTPRL